MNTLMKLVLVVLFALGSVAHGSEQVSAEDQAAGQVLRVGGQYKVESMRKLSRSEFEVIFASVAPSGRFDRLRLVSDHVHVAVTQGSEIRLSAEVLSEAGSTAEVSQVVLFLEGRSGRVPVWLLSTKARPGDLKGARYLEMHAPQTDFIVM